MKQHHKNQQFLLNADAATVDAVLNDISRYFGMGIKEARQEVTRSGAMHLTHYLRGSLKVRVSSQMDAARLGPRQYSAPVEIRDYATFEN